MSAIGTVHPSVKRGMCFKIWIAMQEHLRSGQRTRQQVMKKQRTNRMLMAVTAIFVGCWLPLNVIHLTLDYYEKVR